MSPRSGQVEAGRWKSRALAMLLGLALTPPLLEGALRFAGLFLEGSRAGAAGDATILCQGDSFTFGLYLPPESAYPARLEQLLHAQGDPGARVINAGIPSKPTWIVKQELRARARRATAVDCPGLGNLKQVAEAGPRTRSRSRRKTRR